MQGRLARDEVASFAASTESPTRAIDFAERWLRDHDGGGLIWVQIHTPGSSVLAWQTGSVSVAMYWLATVLGKLWLPDLHAESASAHRAAPATGVRGALLSAGLRSYGLVREDDDGDRNDVA